MSRLGAVLLLCVACACSSDDAGDSMIGDAATDAARDTDDAGDADSSTEERADDGGQVTVLPQALMLNGTAEAEDGEDRVECRFFGMLTELESTPSGEITGVFIGEVFRTAFVGDQRFEFAPLVGGPASITPIEGEQIELRFVGDQPEGALRFWLELEVIVGDDLGGYRYAGDWSCAPGLLDDPGFVDIDLTAPGTWTLEPASL